jgi:hypothetical protein
MMHVLRCDPEPFAAVVRGAKTCEVRKHDRLFAVGDTLVLCELGPWTFDGAEIATPNCVTGWRVPVLVSHVLGGAYGLPEDLCVLSLRPVNDENPSARDAGFWTETWERQVREQAALDLSRVRLREDEDRHTGRTRHQGEQADAKRCTGQR